MYENKGAEKTRAIDPVIFMKTMQLARYRSMSLICNDLAMIIGERLPTYRPAMAILGGFGTFTGYGHPFPRQLIGEIGLEGLMDKIAQNYCAICFI